MKNTKKLNSLKITGLRASTARQNTRRKARVWKDWGAIFWQNWSSGASEKNLYIYDKCSYWLASLPALHITSWEDVVPVNTDGAISESPMCVCVCVCVKWVCEKLHVRENRMRVNLCFWGKPMSILWIREGSNAMQMASFWRFVFGSLL